MSRRDEAYLEHILSACEAIVSYVKGMDREAFLVNSMAQDAVTRRIEIIVEAAGKLSDAFRQARPEVPWSSIVGMRNILIHEYFGVDVDEIWLTATQDVPQLRRALERQT